MGYVKPRVFPVVAGVPHHAVRSGLGFKGYVTYFKAGVEYIQSVGTGSVGGDISAEVKVVSYVLYTP